MPSRQKSSPFQGRQRDGRPKLKFSNPRETEEFVLSQPKTDYTYSTSPSYSDPASDNMDNYDIPFMSRSSYQHQGYTPSNRPTSAATPSGQRQPSLDPSGSRRRSARLAGHPNQNAPPAHNTSTQYPSHHGIRPNRGPRSNADRSRGNSRVHPNSSSTSALFSERDFGHDDQSLTHLYGLDEFDGTELSDTESSQANQKYSSSSSENSEWSERRSSIDIMTVIKTIIITTIYITTFLPRMAYNYVKTRSSTTTPARSSSTRSNVTSFINTVSHTVYTMITSTLLMDVWFLTRTRSWLSSIGVTTPVTAGLKQGSFSSYSSSEHESRERRRQKGGGFPCWVFLILLLLPILSSLYLFWGFVPFLLPLATNRTNETEPIAAVADDMTLLLAGLGDSPASAAGCLQCLRKEDLSMMVLGLIKGTTDRMQGQILEQNKQILMMLKQGSEQESRISLLMGQIKEYQKRKTPEAADSSIEKELVQMRADLRNLVHAAPTEDATTQEHVTNSIDALRVDLDRLTERLSDLGSSFKESKSAQAAVVLGLQGSQDETEEKTREAIEPLYSLRDEFSLRLEDLEGRLTDLRNLLAVLESSSSNQQGQIVSIVDQINTLEADTVGVRETLRTLDVALNNIKIEVGDQAGTGIVNDLRADIEAQRSDISEIQLLLSKNGRNVGNMEVDVETMRGDIEQLEAQRLAQEKSYINDKETFGFLLQKTSEVHSEQITKLSSDIDDRLQVIVGGGGSSDSDDLVRQSLSQLQADLGEEIRKNAEAVQVLQTKLSDLSNALNGTDQQTAGGLLITSKLQTIEGSVRDLKLQLEGMQSLQASVDGSSSVSEAVLAQVAEVRSSLADMEGQLKDAKASVEGLTVDMGDIEMSLSLLQGRTASKSGSPINFVTMETDINMLQQTIENLAAAVDEVKQENQNQERTLTIAVTDSGIVKEQMTAGDGNFINLVLMQSNLDEFQSKVEDMADLLAVLRKDFNAQSDSLGLVLTDRDNQYHSDQISGMNAAIVSLKDSLASLEGSSTDSGDTAGIAVQLVDLGSKVTVIEDGLAALKTGSDGSDLAGLLAGLQSDVDDLKQRVDDLQQEKTSTGGLGVMGILDSDDDGIDNLKSDMSRLNAQYDSLNLHMTDCCRNKSNITGFGFGPSFSFFGTDSDSSSSGDTERIKGIVYGILNQYSADRTGMVDYALESAGGSVVSTRCTETYTAKTALLSILGIPLWYVSNSARTAIQPDVHPGNCWAFKGAIGYLVVQLSDTIQPTYFTMEHIPKSLSPSGEIPSAPRNFSVWSLSDGNDVKGILLGEYVYDDNGTPVQVFPVQQVEITPTMMVELKIHSNYGSLEFTCLYRFRVHGDLYRP